MEDMKKIKMDNKPVYEPPSIKTYSEAELLEELGPAQAIYGPLPFS